MFYIYCPYCGEHREEEEFHPKGQAHIERPKQPEECSDEEWGDYLFFRDNPRGVHHEMWVHAVGVPQVLQRHASHGELRNSRDLQDG